MDNTRDELLDLIRNATNIDMICFFAIIYVVAPDSPPYTPRGYVPIVCTVAMNLAKPSS